MCPGEAGQLAGVRSYWPRSSPAAACYNESNFMNSRAKILVVVSSTFLVLLLVLGSVMGKSAPADSPYHHLAVYTEVLSRIRSEYVEEPDLKSDTLGALNGLLESIDPI